MLSFSSEIIADIQVSGAMPVNITEKSLAKKCSGISGIIIEFSMITAIIGNIRN